MPLDGEWYFIPPSNYPGGNGTPGGEFHFFSNVLPGDVNADRRVNADDLGAVRARQLAAGATVGRADVFCDVDGNGVINAVDLGIVRAAQLTTLPTAAPAALTPAAVRRDDPATALLRTSPAALP